MSADVTMAGSVAYAIQIRREDEKHSIQFLPS